MDNLKTLMRYVVLIVLISTLSCGCLTNKQLRNFTRKHGENSEAELLAESIPFSNITHYRNALFGIRELVTIFDKKQIYIAVEPIMNQTSEIGRLPADIRVMVESALNRMGCSNIIVIPYTETALKRYANKNLYTVHGAITEFDSGILVGSSNNDAGAYAEIHSTDIDAGGDRGNALEISSISIDFTLHDFKSKRYIPGLQISNKMQINRVNKSQGFGFSIYGNGLSINASATFKQGVHSALRLLVELSMVELVGNFHDLPYWITVYENEDLDENIQAKMLKDFELATNRERAKYIQRILSYLYDEPLQIDGIVGNKTKAQIRRFKTDYAIHSGGDAPEKELFLEMLLATAVKFRTEGQY